MPDTACLTVNCSRLIFKRNLCKLCYNRAAYAVTRGKTSWKELVEKVKIAPPRPRGKKRVYYASHEQQVSIVLERILNRTVFQENGCWEWQGAMTGGHSSRNQNSPVVVVFNKNITLHRWVYELTTGQSLTGVQRRCKVNMKCINPDHNLPSFKQHYLAFVREKYRQGNTITSIASSLGVSDGTASKFLLKTEELKKTHEEAAFWQRIDRSGDHWIYIPPRGGKTSSQSVMIFYHQQGQVRHKVWQLCGFTLEKNEILRRICHVHTCVKPAHHKIGVSPTHRLDKTKRKAYNAVRDVELFRLIHDGIPYRIIGEKLGMTYSNVSIYARRAGIYRRRHIYT